MAAEQYDLIRPGYPDDLVAAVLAHCGGARVAAVEAGAGTGKATRAFAAQGLRIAAVEPDPAMAGILADNCTGYPGVTVVVRPFESYVPPEPRGLPFSAQAWHWMDPEVRWEHAADVLAPGGSLALFWNYDRIIDQRVQARITAVHQDLTPHIEWDTDPVPGDGLMDRWPATDLAGLATFTGLQARLFRWERGLSRRQYLDYLATHSAYLVLGEPVRTELFTRISEALPDQVLLAEDTVLYLARRRLNRGLRELQASEQICLGDAGALAVADEPFGPEREAEGLVRHREEERLLTDLAGVGPHGASLVVQVRGYIDRGGDLRLGRTELVLVDVRRFDVLTGRSEHRPAAHDLVPVHRALEDSPRAGQFGGSQAHPVHLDMVRVAVAAMVVVAGEHVGALGVQDRGELLRGLVHGRGPERAPCGVGRGAHHAGVGVPEELHPLRAEDLRRRVCLHDPARPQLLAVGEEALGDLALLTAGGHDQHDPVPLIGGFADHPATRDALVVRVGVERHQSGHGCDATRPAGHFVARQTRAAPVIRRHRD
jgi:SAM-dependent methyltransferase